MWNQHWLSSLRELEERGHDVTRAVEAWCADLDIAWSVAAIAKEWRWCRPVFEVEVKADAEAGGSYFDVEDLRHPVIERLINVPYVSHSISLTEPNSSILLYGMNASGKSSLMKALGLCVILAQAGFPVPAKSLRMRPFTALFTRILGNDNLWAGLSSFAVEMTEFREILQYADERSLVLGDELCSGTESLSATALVAAGIESLVERRSRFVFATHLHELSEIVKAGTIRTLHMKVEYNPATDTLVYDRRLADGPGSALYGLEVCKALGLPAKFLERATTIRKQLSGWVAPHMSVYSSGTVVARCEICESTTGLETHHIVAQADGGTDTDGNLVSLCAKCHDDHHGGRLRILGWVDEGGHARHLRWANVTESDNDSVILHVPPAQAQAQAQANTTITPDVEAFIREQRLHRSKIPTIQRVVKQQFGVELTAAAIKRIR